MLHHPPTALITKAQLAQQWRELAAEQQRKAEAAMSGNPLGAIVLQARAQQLSECAQQLSPRRP